MRPIHAAVIGIVGVGVVVLGSKMLFPGNHDAQALFRLGCLVAAFVAVLAFGHSHHSHRHRP